MTLRWTFEIPAGSFLTGEYSYPTSAVKLPGALLALAASWITRQVR